MLKFATASLLILPVAFGQMSLTTAQIAKSVSPSIVVIQGKTDSGDVLGSGFVISNDGKIVTNLHVIRDMKPATVQLANGDLFDTVSVLATDERRDIAVLKVAGFNLPVLELGNSDVLTVGEPLVIVGSPYGLEGTVTAGILSSVRDSGEGFKVLQTDASVNPGNSGGPLLDSKGQAVGMLSFKLRSAEGLNFAVPINYVRGLLNNLHEPLSLEQMRRSLVGVTSAVPQNSGPSLKETLDWLKESIPLGAVHYVRRPRDPDERSLWGNAPAVSIGEQPIVYSLDSCSAGFGRVITLTVPDHPEVPALTATVRYAVPVGLLTGASVARAENIFTGVLDGLPGMGEPLGEFVGGERWSYRVILTSESKAILVTTSDWLHVPDKTISTEAIYLTFSDEPVARRAVDAFMHAAALCRESGSAMPTPESNSSGPSLKDTLDFLKEKIPLGTVNYVISSSGMAVSTNEQSAVFGLDSCTGVFGDVITLTIGDDLQHRSVGTYRYTVPLGALTGFFVERAENSRATFVSGEKWGYHLHLGSGSKDISVASFPPDSTIPDTSVTDQIVLKFNDESMAKRVLEAFRHASYLCRRKEAF